MKFEQNLPFSRFLLVSSIGFVALLILLLVRPALPAVFLIEAGIALAYPLCLSFQILQFFLISIVLQRLSRRQCVLWACESSELLYSQNRS